MTPQHSELPDQVPASDDLKNALRAIFDSQILNYGDYNLVFAANEHFEQREADGTRVVKPRYYVVGYRWQPAELMIAPVNAPTLTGGGVPVEVNMTNLSHAIRLAGGDVEVGTSTGKTFRFGVRPEARFSSGSHDLLIIDQQDDQLDFEAFMAAFIEMA